MLQFVASEVWLEMYSGYKQKLADRELNKWTEYEVEMPRDRAEVIAKRVASGT